MENKIVPDDPYYKKMNFKLHDVRFGNLFDGDMSYSFIGFPSAIVIYMHSPYETMNIARSIAYTSEAYEFEVLSIEIITTKDFRDDTFISQRGCRFHSESNLTHYKVYSKLLCHSECRLNLALEVSFHYKQSCHFSVALKSVENCGKVATLIINLSYELTIFLKALWMHSLFLPQFW
jgi:Amiloride-sensitive sodium channel